jgi:hypothetical protein
MIMVMSVIKGFRFRMEVILQILMGELQSEQIPVFVQGVFMLRLLARMGAAMALIL